MADLPAVVAAREELASDIVGIELVLPGRDVVPAFTAGGHIDVHLGNGMVRQYSLCNGPRDTASYQIAVKRAPKSRGGSTWIHDALRVGARLQINAPRNNFPLVPNEAPPIFFAGGIGITPFISMAKALMAEGRSFHLHYFSQSPAHAAFKDWLGSIEAPSLVSFHFGLEGDAVAGAIENCLARAERGSDVYICGPAPFMDLVRFLASGLPSCRVFTEYFQNDLAVAPAGASFRVELARSGKTVEVAEGETIIAALDRIGVEVEVSCEEGVCGTCLTKVLSGIPDHRDVFLTPEEKARNDRMTLCCSRALSDALVLDR